MKKIKESDTMALLRGALSTLRGGKTLVEMLQDSASDLRGATKSGTKRRARGHLSRDRSLAATSVPVRNDETFRTAFLDRTTDEP